MLMVVTKYKTEIRKTITSRYSCDGIASAASTVYFISMVHAMSVKFVTSHHNF